MTKKIDTPLINSMLMSLFVSSLPQKMSKFVRQAHSITSEDTVKVVMYYRSVDVSSFKSHRKKNKYQSSRDESSDEFSS